MITAGCANKYQYSSFHKRNAVLTYGLSESDFELLLQFAGGDDVFRMLQQQHRQAGCCRQNLGTIRQQHEGLGTQAFHHHHVGDEIEQLRGVFHLKVILDIKCKGGDSWEVDNITKEGNRK